jgi:hypothetical protein
MKSLFHNLLVSAPNIRGGLFVVRHGVAHRVDTSGSTGVACNGEAVYRAIQPTTCVIYGATPRVIAGWEGVFADIHDVASIGGEIYLACTGRNAIVKFSPTMEVLQEWRLPGEGDSCHVNCVGTWRDAIVYSYFGDFSAHREFKGATYERGMVRDLLSGEILVRGLSQPHSPTSSGEHLLVANSELHEIREYNTHGELVRAKALGAFTRGILVRGDVVFVGLSVARWGTGLDTTEQSSQIVALDRSSWEELGRLAVPSNEIFSIVEFEGGIEFAVV